MSLPWFRMYSEFAKDPKVQSMDETLQRRLVMMFCLKCSDELSITHDELACALRISSEELETTLEVFRRKGFVDENDNLCNWEKRQFKSDSSTERVRRFRERKGNGDETLRNVSETPPDTDTDTESDKEKEARAKSARVPSRHIDLIFRHWKTTFEHPQAQCSDKRRRLIRQALKNYGFEAVRNAISGYKLSPFHNGDNPNGQVYDSLELFLRDTEHIERGLGFFASPPTTGVQNGANRTSSKASRYEQSTERLREWADA